jgi:hypothetical protein
VAVIGGDGIGPEVTQAALDVVAAAGVVLETTSFDLGAARYLRDGFVLDDATLEELRTFEAILLGAIGPAIGDTRIAGGVLSISTSTIDPFTVSRDRSRRDTTSRSFARTPRAPTRARAASFATAPLMKSRRRGP